MFSCETCDKKYKTKGYYNKHILNCKYKTTTNKRDEDSDIYNLLNKINNDLLIIMNKHNELENKHNELEIKHNELENKHNKLENKHNELENKHNELENKIMNFKSIIYNNKNVNYIEILNNRYNNINCNFDNLINCIKVNRNHLEYLLDDDHDLKSSILYILNELKSTFEGDIPIKCLNNKIYVFNDKKWKIIINKDINRIIKTILCRYHKELSKSCKETENHTTKYQENYLKYVGKINNYSEIQINAYLKTNMYTIFKIDI